ncbi:unnamed protein product [Nyctereutes procyonoides]|uniref:(raccoon dog) hypothetical protein n=1 Tax=Nyctereutes procyonoides TaxID=34880 RepID=A0A811YTW0_NYCPR|nr:unnamed protein product [Nyctereutes procyonoides]
MTKNKTIFQPLGSSIWWKQQTITTGCQECRVHRAYENSYGHHIQLMCICDIEVYKRQQNLCYYKSGGKKSEIKVSTILLLKSPLKNPSCLFKVLVAPGIPWPVIA